jgi:hemolysin activation/secretion protein
MTRILGDRRGAFIALVLLLCFGPVGFAQDEDIPQFDILEFAVDGNTVLPAAAIEKAVYPFMGPSRTIEDVEEARAALERAYQQAGYLTVIVNLPEQRVDDGVVRLDVVEGVVDRFRVTGNRYYSRGYIRSRLPAIQPGEVPYFPDLQDQIANFNQSPGRSVTPVLKPGGAPGSVGMEMKVADRSPLHGSIELNNRQTLNTEPLRLAGTLRYDNLWGRDHAISFLYLASPQQWDQVRVLSVNYLFRLTDSDKLVALYAVRSRSSVAAVGDLKVLGNANLYGARLIVPMRPLHDYTHSFVLGIDYKDFLQDLRFVDAGPQSFPIDYTPVSAGYQFTKNGERGQTRGGITLNVGIRGRVLSNRDSEFENQRFDARANFIYLRGDISRLQALPRGYGLYARIGAQLASQPLIPLEQLLIGGLDTVRGYLEAEAVGDDGAYGTIELRTPPMLRAYQGPALELIGLAFVDAGTVTTRQPLPGQQEHVTLASAGVGLRFRAEKHFTAAMELGVPMRDALQSRAGNPFAHMRMVVDF